MSAQKTRLLLLGLLMLLAPVVARAGGVDGQAALDVFHADSVSGAASGGDPDFVAAQELGLNLRLDVRELDDRLRARAHYRGREPLPGTIVNEPLRTLYEAWVRYEVWQDVVTASAGRFFVPSPLFLVVDGAAVSVKLPLGFEAGAFGGRRGLTTSRREAGIDKWLPAAGASFAWRHELVETSLHFNYAEDEGVFLKASDELTLNYGGFNLMATVTSRPFSWLLFGGQLSFVQQGNYVIGPTWSTVKVEAKLVDFTTGYAWVEWRPWKLLRFSYDVHHQRPGLVRSGTVTGEDPTLAPELVDPSFLDNRVRVSVSPFAIGWLSGGVRHRLRPDRHELRYFGELDVNHLIPLGVYGRAQLMYEDIIPTAGAADADRLLGVLLVGWQGFGFDASTGASYIERSAAPLSGRQADATSPADLSPFVLEAQRLVFVRGSYSAREWFVGVDLERNIDDNEYRAFAQVGGRLELSW